MRLSERWRGSLRLKLAAAGLVVLLGDVVFWQAKMKTLSRKRVQACLIAKMSQVSPVCHATMMTLKSQHDAARHQPALPAKR